MENFARKLLLKRVLRPHRPPSHFLTSSRRAISTETLANFPYKFGNTKELIFTGKDTKAESIDTMNELINLDKYKLK
jgi:hypothetical protein